MPITINVGLSKKASKNFNSEGASINLVAELDAGLMHRHDQLQAKIDELYDQAEAALDRRIRIEDSPVAKKPQPTYQRIPQSNGNGSTATEAQRKAIFAIGKSLEIDPDVEAHEVFGIDPKNLSIKDASKLIDHLKQLQGSNA